jgi:hypothetical protein
MRRALLCLVLCACLAEAQTPVQFRVVMGDIDSNGVPITAARLCSGSVGAERCYEPPKHSPPFGLDPKTQEIKPGSGKRLILFTAESSTNGSGSLKILALLEDRNNQMIDLLPRVTLSNQSEYSFWDLPGLSPMPVLITADFVWAESETHFAHHRYRITSYVYDKQKGLYARRDQYVTAEQYPGLDESDAVEVLAPEKPIILSRLNNKLR